MEVVPSAHPPSFPPTHPPTQWTTLPEHFKNHGFWTAGSGKLFHPDLPPNDDNPRSWSINYTDPGENQGCTCPTTGVPGAPMYCELPADTDCPDVVVADTVVAQMRAWKAAQSGVEGGGSGGVGGGGDGGGGGATPPKPHQPFFLGLGIHKPHLPWGAPKQYFDQYPPASALPLATHKYVPENMPPVAYHHCQWGPFPWNSSKGTPIDDAIAGEARRGYYAAISFADHLVGTVLEELDAIGESDNTVVLFSSDHGWQLGEHNEWCKETVFELSLRIPFMIRLPRAAGGSPTPPGTTRVFAENIDIYRTLADLAGVPDVEEGVDGVSLAPLLRYGSGDEGGLKEGTGVAAAAVAALRSEKTAAFAQHARCLRDPAHGYSPIDPYTTADSCTVTPRENLDWMGYSIRTDDWRYTAWVGWNGTSLTPHWDVVNATELYVHTVEEYGAGGDEGEGGGEGGEGGGGEGTRGGSGPSDQDFDAWENVNVVNKPGHAAVVTALHGQLQAHFDRFALPYQAGSGLEFLAPQGTTGKLEPGY